VIRWRKATGTASSLIHTNCIEESDRPYEEISEIDELVDQLDEEAAPRFILMMGISSC
jgi:hypothetical protein